MVKQHPIIKNNFDINAYVFLDNLKKQIHQSLDRILKQCDQGELKEMIYTILKELVINATKANIKRIVFAENNLDIDNYKDWKIGTSLFREKLRESYIEDFAKKTKSLNFKVKINYIYNKDGIKIEVCNNTPIPRLDDEKMRKLLALAMKYDSISDFYIDNVEKLKLGTLEGAGMGLAMVIIILKNKGFEPGLLRIGIQDDKTIARIEIPFTNSYIPFREKIYRKKLKSKRD